MAIEALVAAGDLDRAARLVARLEALRRRLPCRAPRAVVAWGGAIAWRQGNLEVAAVGFKPALQHNAAVPMPLAHAETLIAYRRFLRHTGNLALARETLHQALAVLEPTGAGRLQKIAHEELAGAGGRRRRARPVDELTAREEQVIKLAAQGLTSPQIVRVLYLSSRTGPPSLPCLFEAPGPVPAGADAYLARPA